MVCWVIAFLGIAMVASAGTAAAQTPRLSVFDENALEGDAITFKVLLSAKSNQPVTVEYATRNGASIDSNINAQSGRDFTAASGTLTFAPGETRKTVRISTTEDSIYEWNEGFGIRLSSPTNARLGRSTATGRIDNDDPLPTVSVSDGSATEGDSVEFKVSLSAPVERTVYVTLKPEVGPGDTATLLADFDGTESPLGMIGGTEQEPLSFPVRVVTADDDIDEKDETFTVRLLNPRGLVLGDATATGTIVDDDDGTPPPPGELPTVGFLLDPNVAEGGWMRFWVKLSKRSDRQVSVQYSTPSGTAESGKDFTPASGLLVFPPGDTFEAVYVQTTRLDSADEGNETFTMTLSSPIRATLGDATAMGTITEADTDVDGSPYVVVAASTNAVEGKSVTFTVRLSAPSKKQATVEYEARGRKCAIVNGVESRCGTAKSGIDYVATSGTLTFAPHETEKTVSVPTIDDDGYEGKQYLNLKLSNPTNAVFRTRRSSKDDEHKEAGILDNDAPPVASFALQASDAKEDSGTQNVTVNLSPAPTWAITLSFTEGGTTTPGRHYGPLSGKVSVPAGATTATIPVQIIDDSVDDDGETIVLTLIAGKGYTVGTSDTHTLTIRNHEPAVPTVTVARKAGTMSSVTEGDSASFTVTASTAPTADLEVTLAVADDGTSDFLAAGDEGTKTVTIAASQTSADLTVPTQDDSVDEVDGSVTATVEAGSGYTPSGTNASASVAVSDDDEPTLSVAMSPASASEGDTGKTYATVTFGLDPVRGEATSFKACLKNTGTATRGASADYQLVNAGSDTPLTLTSDCHSYTLAANAANGTVRLLVRGDGSFEPDETVVVELKDPPAGVVVSGTAGTATYTILNDDAAPAACVPAALLEKVEGYYDHNKDRPSGYGANWFRVLVAFGARSPDGWTADNRTIVPMPAADARARQANWFGWGPVADALECLEGATPTEPVITVAGGSGVTEGGDAVFTVSASSAPAANLTVSLAVADDGASDFLATSDEGTKTVTIAANQASAALTLATVQDSNDEADGSVTASVASGTGYRVGSASTATVSVADDDVLPVVGIAGGAGVTEGGDAVFTLTAAPAPQSDITVAVDVVDSGDFASSGEAGARQVTIGTTGTATLDVATDNDTADESDGSITATVGAGSGYTPSGTNASASVAVSDDDEPTLSVAMSPASASEGDTGKTYATVTFGLDPVRGEATSFKACLKNTGTATRGASADYQLVNAGSDTPLTLTSDCHSYTLAANAASGTVRFLIRGDAEVEPDETVVVELKDPPVGVVVSGTAGTATYTIVNDDAAPTACVPAALLEKVEGYYDHNKDKPSGYGANWFRVLVAFGARSPDGWTADNRTIVPMPAADARAREANWFGWGPVADALECLEGTTPAEPEITIAGGTGVTEGGDAVFTVSASPAPTANLTVSLTVADDANSDFLAAGDEGKKTVTIAANQASADLTVPTQDDSANEADGSVTATVQAGSGYTPSGTNGSASVAVSDDDGPPPTPVVSVSAGADVDEGGNAVFTVSASPAPTANLTVSLTVADDGASDFLASGDEGKKTVTIAANQSSADLTLATQDDSVDEADGSVTATVQVGSGYTPSDTNGSDSVAVSDNDDPPPTPAVSVSAGADVDEGGNAGFTITASPAPATGLTIAYTVAQSGDYLDAPGAGRRTVTLAAGATGAGLAVATVDDAADEADGAVSVTLASGTGYTLATGQDSAMVTVRDNDEPVVSIAGGAGVTEGTDASFTVTANPAPAAPLDVALTIAQSGDFAASGETGSRTVTVPVTGSLDVEVPTVNDTDDEPDGSVSAALEAGTGYTVAASPDNAATVAVSDNDAAATAPTFSVGDETANENVGMMYFTVRLDRAVQKTLKVTVTARESNPVSARYGEDFLWWWPDGTALTFWPGQTEKKMPVFVYNDNHDEDPETFEVALSRPTGGAVIGDGVAVGTIVNNDPMPAAWLARFGRTVAEQALDGIAERMAAPRSAGVQGSFARQPLGFHGPGPGLPVPASGASPGRVPRSGVFEARAAEDFGSLSGAGAHGSWPGEGPGRGAGDAFGHEGSGAAGSSYSMTLRDIMLGSSFTATGETDGSGGSLAFWGRAAHSRFDGREGSFSLDGEATTAMLGADYARSQWLVGMALMQSGGEGGYRDTETGSRTASQICTDAENGMDPQAREVLCDGAVREGDGEVEASLTAAVPYASLQASERLKLWGALGHGTGEVTLKPAMGGSLTSGISWTMAAAGLRGDVIAPPAEGSGPALAVTSDALWARTSSEKTHELAASDSDVTRLRLGLEGRWTHTLEGGGHFTPKLEAGMRHDGGDAETGFGVELGGGLAWSAPALGLNLDLSGRTLLAHGDDDLKDRGFAAAFAFDPDPESERGPSLSLGQSFGGQATGGLDALFAVNPLEDRAGQEAQSRWTAEAAWGFAAFGGRFTGSPHLELGLPTGTRDYTLGYRVVPARDTPALDVSFGVAARRSEGEDDRADHAVSVEFGARW